MTSVVEQRTEEAASPETVAAAEEADLVYTSDAEPGIRRVGRAGRFRFVYSDGKQVRDERTLERIRRIAVPPAWTDVWISPRDDGHLQATGRDAKGRKQYRYRARWREVRDRSKYNRMVAFGRALPRLREWVEEDLSLPGLPREKVLALVVRLLEATLLRVGNEEYVRSNGAYGLTTLRGRHVAVNGATVRFEFTGKGGKKHSVRLRNRRLAQVVKRCQDLPGQELFQYSDEAGERRRVDSADVNAYLREVAGESFTAKDFRTWGGTVLAARELLKVGEAADGDSLKKRRVAEVFAAVSRRLGNTPSVCRKCYVHPALIDDYLSDRLVEELSDHLEDAREKGLSREEAALLSFLEQRVEEEQETLEEKVEASIEAERSSQDGRR